ncbi:MAG: DUF1501 domain-containing protein [Planctomycetaceae bacterium]|nr:DUF1501 domain-containing protein [Planctomycetaceae bacterium]
MLNIFDRQSKSSAYCDAVSRRSFLQIGSLGAAGLGLGDLLRREAAAGVTNSHKAVIMVYCCGGPPHQDMYDLKPDAPSEVRGELNPIKTNVPGIEICELLPQMAGMMDKLVPIRTMSDCQSGHTGFQCFTGNRPNNEPAGGWPHIGSVASHFKGPVHDGVPPFVSLCYTTQHTPYNEPKAGFLGLGHSSFRPSGPGKGDLTLNGITTERLGDRRGLLTAFDRFRRQWDSSGQMQGMDAFSQRAMGILTSTDLFNALDVSSEDPKLVERYGSGDATKPKGDGAPRVPQNFLMARRLVEAGVRVVTVNYSFWDWHGGNFDNAREELPVFDQGISALVQDLHDRGMSDDVTVVAWGEFGRTPKINDKGGRDHWPRVSCALLAGGGMRTGQVLGATDPQAGEPVDRPVTFKEVYATIYHNLGIDLDSQRLFDFSGRPQYLVAPGALPIRELL